jgi:hypothetical protein
MNNRLIALHQWDHTNSPPQFSVDENFPFIGIPPFDFHHLADHTLCATDGSSLFAKHETNQRDQDMLDNLKNYQSDYQGNQHVLNHDCLDPESSGQQMQSMSATRRMAGVLVAKQFSSGGLWRASRS